MSVQYQYLQNAEGVIIEFKLNVIIPNPEHLDSYKCSVTLKITNQIEESFAFNFYCVFSIKEI